MGLDVLSWLAEGGLGLREFVGLEGGLGLWGWLIEDATSETLDQLTSHVPRGPRTSLIWRSTSNSPSVPSEATIGSCRPIKFFSFPRQLLRESWV